MSLKRERLPMRRARDLNERMIVKAVMRPGVRMRLSRALSKPFSKKDIYISGHGGKYVHFLIARAASFDKKSFRVKPAGESGTKLIVGCPRGQYDPVTNTCRVAMRLQSVLVPKTRVKEAIRNPMKVTRRRRAVEAASYTSNPLLMSVTNPGFEKNPIDVEYDASQKVYKVYRTNPGHEENFPPLWNDNPRRKHYCDNPAYCDNPIHDDNISPSEAAGMWNDNPEDRIPPAHLAGAWTENPGSPDISKTFEENAYNYRPHGPRALQDFQRPGPSRYPRYGELSHLSKQPKSRPGVKGYSRSVRKVKIPIAKFEAWLSRYGSPDEKRRYAKAKAAFKRFHKGGMPTFVVRKVVDVGAGKQILGRSFAYSMGKSPFEPYVTPKGSGKGDHKAYLHEYETMPDGVTVPGGKVVIKPLDGRTKITDWIHY